MFPIYGPDMGHNIPYKFHSFTLVRKVQFLAKHNRGVRYLLTVIDALSKYAWVEPLKDKTGVSVVKALDDIVKKGRQPNRLQTDKGKEFYN